MIKQRDEMKAKQKKKRKKDGKGVKDAGEWMETLLKIMKKEWC